jgi:hypothetical protein
MLTVAPGRGLAVVMVSAAVTVMVNAWVAVAFAASVTCTVTEKLPAAVGVPDMTPAELIERPLGRPEADQVYGGAPPVAARVVAV